MNIPLLSKKSVAVGSVLLLAATIVPSSASASTTENPEDNVVSVLIDLREDGGDEDFCEGSAVLNIPDTQPISASLNTKIVGIQDPTLGEIISYWFPYYGEGVRIDALLELTNQPETTPAEATLENIESISYNTEVIDYYEDVVDEETGLTTSVARYRTVYSSYDLNEDGVIDATDAPGFMTETRRAYTTEWFEVSFDADDCEVNSANTERVGILLAGRGELLHSTDEGATWNSAELPSYYDGELMSSEVVSMGTSRLRLKTNLIGGLISLPLAVAWEPAASLVEGTLVFEPDNNGMWPVAFGDEASAEMKAIVEIMGTEKPTGMYLNEYYFQLMIEDEFYLGEELLWILGCGVGAYYCGP